MGLYKNVVTPRLPKVFFCHHCNSELERKFETTESKSKKQLILVANVPSLKGEFPQLEIHAGYNQGYAYRDPKCPGREVGSDLDGRLRVNQILG